MVRLFHKIEITDDIVFRQKVFLGDAEALVREKVVVKTLTLRPRTWYHNQCFLSLPRQIIGETCRQHSPGIGDRMAEIIEISNGLRNRFRSALANLRCCRAEPKPTNVDVLKKVFCFIRLVVVVVFLRVLR